MSLIESLTSELHRLTKYKNFSRWALRISVVIYLVLLYSRVLIDRDYDSGDFVLSISFLVLAIMLLIGGFFKHSTITKLSAISMLVLMVVLFVISVMLHRNILKLITENVLLSGVLFYFATSSNWKEYSKHSKIKAKDIFTDENTNQ